MYHLWLMFSAAAVAVSLAHVLIDYHIGLYGASDVMRPIQAENVLLTCVVYGWWAAILGIASEHNKAALLSALILVIGWAVVWNGIVGLFVSPPPSSAHPYQDIAHIANIVVGAIAAYLIWQQLRVSPEAIHWLLPSSTLCVVLLACAVQSVLGLSTVRSEPRTASVDP